MDTLPVTIKNTENNTIQEFNIYPEILTSLKTFTEDWIHQHPTFIEESPWGHPDAFNSMAVYGIWTLFEHIPSKFPIKNLIYWVQEEINPGLSLPALEKILAQFSLTHLRG